MPCLKSRALFISHFQVEVEEDATCSAFPELQTKPLQTLMEIHLQGKINNKDYDLFGNKKQICDQKLKGGNLALKNNIKKSIPVRVIRGHKSRNSYCGKVYTYNGLYKVAIKNPLPKSKNTSSWELRETRMEMDLISRTTKLAYSDDMCCLKSRALFISHFQVFHYGYFVASRGGECDPKLEKGLEVCLYVDEQRHILNSRPFVEYKGTVPQIELQSKQKELELEANVLIAKGAKVLVAVLAYDEASELCGGRLPGYISKCSTLRVVKLGNNPGCPCGGTHVADISDIGSLKVTQIRMKKGFTKVFYIVGSTVDIQFERKNGSRGQMLSYIQLTIKGLLVLVMDLI